MTLPKTNGRLTSLLSIVLGLLLFLEASSSWARCFIPSVEESFKESAFVFSGTVSRVDKEEQTQNSGKNELSWSALETVTFDVDKTWKGVSKSNSIGITTPSNNYAFICAVMGLSVGDKFLIFARKAATEKESDDSDSLYTDRCQPNKRLDDDSETAALFEQLDALRSELTEESEETPDEESKETQSI